MKIVVARFTLQSELIALNEFMIFLDLKPGEVYFAWISSEDANDQGT